MKKLSKPKYYFARLFSEWREEIYTIKSIWSKETSLGSDPRISLFERIFMTVIASFRFLSLVHLKGIFRNNYYAKSLFSELYVLVWFLLLIYLLFVPTYPLHWILILGVGYRIVDGIIYRLSILFIDRHKDNWGLRSHSRSVLLLFVNYLEIIVGFAIFYIQSKTIISSTGELIKSPLEALYFSVVTITTLGYGDFSPSAKTLGQTLVITEVLLGFFFIVVVLTIFMSGTNFVKEKTL